VIQALITNVGKYAENKLSGEELTFPTTKEQVQRLLARIGVDGVRYEEIFIVDYASEIPGLSGCFGEHEDIDELNYLASLLAEMSERELEQFAAAVEYGDYTNGAQDLINLAQNLEHYDYFPGIHSHEDLGYYMIDELGTLDLPESIEPYFDHESYGRDEALNRGGRFTDGGFIAKNRSGFMEHYSGRADLPDEYKVFAYPEPEKSIKKTIAAYNQMIQEAPIIAHNRPQAEHEDRGG